MLEQVFKCPRTLVRLRSAPLGKLLEEFCKSLLDRGFRRGITRRHVRNASHLNEHLRRPRSRMRQTVTAGEIEGFFDEYAARCRDRGLSEGHLRRVRRSVKLFAEHLRQEGRFVAPATHAIYQPLLDAYLQWMRCYQHAVPGTLDLRGRSLTQFLRWLGPDAVPRRLACLSCEKVEQFILAYAADKGRAARRAMQSALRTFLAVRFARGLPSAIAGPRRSHAADLQIGHRSAQSQRATGPRRAARHRA